MSQPSPARCMAMALPTRRAEPVIRAALVPIAILLQTLDPWGRNIGSPSCQGQPGSAIRGNGYAPQTPADHGAWQAHGMAREPGQGGARPRAEPAPRYALRRPL